MSLVISTFVLQPSYGQDKQSQDDVTKVDSTLVTVPTTVFDRDGRYVINLKKEDFQIFEDGAEQGIALFEPVEQQSTVFLLLDVSGSMTYQIGNIANAASVFLQQLRPEDRLTAATFDDMVDTLFDFSEVKEIRGKRKFRLRVAASKGDTMVYDAVEFAMKKINKVRGRKAIVLFSDGKGSGYSASAKSNLKDAEEQDALIYTVQFDTLATPSGYKLTKEDIARYKQSTEIATLYMQALAAKTGGRRYWIKDITNLDKTFGEIADELGRQYSLSYYPKQLETGQKRQLRQIKVKVRQPNLVVRARDSYIFQSLKNK